MGLEPEKSYSIETGWHSYREDRNRGFSLLEPKEWGEFFIWKWPNFTAYNKWG